jgi:predicted alpha/beta-fold hydrolase
MKIIKIFFTFIILYFTLTSKVFTQVQPIKVELISDGYKLNAEIFHSVSEQPIPTFILMHGFPGGEGDPLGLGKKLSALGINVFVFNFRGTWSSEGEFSFENSMEDIGSTIDFLKMYDHAF